MNTTEIKRLVRKFRSEHRIKVVTAKSLENAFQQQGFTIIDFNPVVNDDDVSTVIRNLGLSEMIRHSNGFLYTDANYRLVFVNEKLSDGERKIILAHEMGHYLCGHSFTRDIVGRNVAEELEANEFSHYLLQETISVRASKAVSQYKKPLIIGAVVASLAGGGSVVSHEYHERQLYEGEYYVTMHGEKYHRKNCVTIEGHEIRRLTKEDVESGRYEPCSVCQPEEDS